MSDTGGLVYAFCGLVCVGLMEDSDYEELRYIVSDLIAAKRLADVVRSMMPPIPEGVRVVIVCGLYPVKQFLRSSSLMDEIARLAIAQIETARRLERVKESIRLFLIVDAGDWTLPEPRRLFPLRKKSKNAIDIRFFLVPVIAYSEGEEKLTTFVDELDSMEPRVPDESLVNEMKAVFGAKRLVPLGVVVFDDWLDIALFASEVIENFKQALTSMNKELTFSEEVTRLETEASVAG